MPDEKRELVDYVIIEHNLNIRQACLCVGIQRCVYYYQKSKNEAKIKEDELLAQEIRTLAYKHTQRGFPMIFKLLRRQGETANRKRVYRIYRQLGLSLRRKKCKQRLPDRIKEQLVIPRLPNQVWSMDFMSDGLQSGRKFRTLNIIDDFNRELLDITIDTNISAHKVVQALDSLIFWRGTPKEIRVDNGSEFISHVFADWAERNSVTIKFIQKGKPTQNGLIERFNRSYREDVLDAYLFHNLDDVRSITEEWMAHYNFERPHSSLGDLTPIEYREKYYTFKEESMLNNNSPLL